MRISYSTVTEWRVCAMHFADIVWRDRITTTPFIYAKAKNSLRNSFFFPISMSMSRFISRRGLPTFICFALFMVMFVRDTLPHALNKCMHAAIDSVIMYIEKIFKWFRVDGVAGRHQQSLLNEINYGIYYYSKWSDELQMVFRSSGCHAKNQKR